MSDSETETEDEKKVKKINQVCIQLKRISNQLTELYKGQEHILNLLDNKKVIESDDDDSGIDSGDDKKVIESDDDDSGIDSDDEDSDNDSYDDDDFIIDSEKDKAIVDTKVSILGKRKMEESSQN